MEGAMYVRPMDLSGHEKLGVLMLGLKQYQRPRVNTKHCSP